MVADLTSKSRLLILSDTAIDMNTAKSPIGQQHKRQENHARQQ